ncbi:putative RNA-binding protein [Escovopsis weberi]|uniref:Putative RNA-binding protein n=1 Tax=Escovopsis weberi TaxID=150374 RepID=A0A0M8MZB5_ESCWE|nr:putative RNA-binding protein [Escovopsis weberi]
MSLGDFLTDSFGGGSSWADEVEETYVPTGTQQLPPPREGSRLNAASSWQDRGYSVRESVPSKLPEKPPFTAHLGNLSYDATNDSVAAFFEGCEVVSVRIIEDREMMRPKGFGYVEFGNLEGLKKALTLDGESFEGRMIKIKVADPPRGGDGRAESSRDLSDWSRKGPLPDLPGRSGPRQAPDFGERRPPRDPAAESRPMRELNWERRGPLSPLAQEPVSSPRDSSRSRPATGGMGERSDSFRGNRADPAAWGEGREDRPRREFQERPERPERVPTAADKDMRWRDRMRPDAAVQSPVASEAPETPTSPAVPAAPAGRPRLALTKRTVTESTDVAPTPSDSKASPFGAARPIDTAAREKEIAEKRQQVLQEKREADEKAKEEKRLAKEAAAKEAAVAEAAAAEAAAKEAAAAAEAAAAKAEAEAEAAAAAKPAPVEAVAAAEVKAEAEKTEIAKQNGAEQKLPFRNREPKESRDPAQQAPKSRATESGNWRSASNEQRNNRGPPGGPRGGRNGGGHSGRGGPRNDNRTPRSNGASGQEPAAAAVESEAGTVDEDGWTTVPNKKGRAGRPLMS